MHYLLISFSVFLISTMLFKKAAGSLSPAKPNMISYIYYYQVLAMSFIAAVLTVLYLDNHYVISRVSDEARLYGWLSVMYVMVAVPIGMLISKRMWLSNKRVGKVLSCYTKSPINTFGFNGNPLKYSVWVFTVISFLACLYTFYNIGYFPFIKALTTPGDVLDVIRISSSRNF